MYWYLSQYNSPYSPDYIIRLEAKVDSFETMFYLLILLSLFLFGFILYQFYKIRSIKRNTGYMKSASIHSNSSTQIQEKRSEASADHSNSGKHVLPAELLHSRLIYKYVLSSHSPEKVITIGQREGSIKTFSTEVVDNHLTISIKVNYFQEQNDLEHSFGEYVINFLRGAKVLYCLPGSNKFQEMETRMKIHVQSDTAVLDEPCFGDISSSKPLRLRLGDKLGKDGKFHTGYFEFHLYTKFRELPLTKEVSPQLQDFYIKLYKIYPGYDTASRNEDGLYSMIEPLDSQKFNNSRKE